ncbi:MAG: metal-sensing transcriptional repressor [Rubrivivax sp.]
METATVHQTHTDVLKRLKRAGGHLQNVIAMLEQERPCLDVAQQLQAVERAVCAAKKLLIHDHIDHCLERSVAADPRAARGVIGEFKAITKYL